jgi:hypothetical protein
MLLRVNRQSAYETIVQPPSKNANGAPASEVTIETSSFPCASGFNAVGREIESELLFSPARRHDLIVEPASDFASAPASRESLSDTI